MVSTHTSLLVRLRSSEEHTVIEKTAGVLVADSLSSNQRWLVLKNPTGIGRPMQFYDLHQGKLVGEVNMRGSQYKWHENQLIVYGDSGQQIEVWLANPLKLLYRTAPLNEMVQHPNRRYQLSQAIDPQGLRVARLSELGKLTISKLIDQREAMIESEQLGGNRQQLEWQTDGSLIVQVDDRWYRWQSDLSDVHGSVTEISPESRSQVISPSRPKRAANEQPHPGIGSQSHFQELIFANKSPLTSGRTAYRLRGLTPGNRTFIWDRGLYFLLRVSPDGQYFLHTESSDRGRFRWSVKSTITNETLYDFGDFFVERGSEPFAWSDSSRWLIISGNRRLRPTLVFDAQLKMVFDLKQYRLPTEVASERVDMLHVVGETFLLTMRGQPGNIWRIDPEGRDAKLLSMPESLKELTLFQFAGLYAFFSPPTKLPVGNELPGQRLIVRAKLEGDTWTELTRMHVGELDDLFISPTGEAYLRVVNPEGTEYHLRPGRDMTKVIPAAGMRFLTAAHWPAGEDSNVEQHRIKSWKSNSRVDRPIWHETGKSVALQQNQGVVVLYLATGMHCEYPRWNANKASQLIPENNGWLVWHPSEFWALSHSGQKLGVLPLKFGVTNEPDGQENWVGTWILADGRTHPQAVGERYFVGRRGAEFITIPLHQPIGDNPLPELPTYPADASFDDLFR